MDPAKKFFYYVILAIYKQTGIMVYLNTRREDLSCRVA